LNVSRLRKSRVSRVLDDSSGNAGSSLAAYCAAARISCRLYVPSDASGQKIRQAGAYGAEIVRVEGSRSEVERRAREPGRAARLSTPHMHSVLTSSRERRRLRSR